MGKPTATELAHIWIDKWNEGDPDNIPLDKEFTHSSPFGTVSGREKYLEWVKPLAAKNVSALRIVRIIGDNDQAAIYFEMNTSEGWVPVVDWLDVKDGKILKIQSFYDASGLKGLPDNK